MKKLIRALAIGMTAVLLIIGAPTAAHAANGFYTQNGRLYDANGSEFVMRGINHPHNWFRYKTGSFQEIADLGANTIRVVLGSGDKWDRTSTDGVADVVRRCKAAKLVCVLEVHDTTGYRDANYQPAGAISLDRAVDYWKSIAGAIKGQERYVIINIGNEPYGNPSNGKVYDWTTDTSAAIKEMRAAGFTHTLMVDAPNWGQDGSNTMREDGGRVLAADPQDDTMLSVHMYSNYQDEGKIRNYLEHFIRWNKWPIVIGEFGHALGSTDVNENAIMRQAKDLGVGYIAWSYSGNAGSDAQLDIVRDFDPNQLTSWGSNLLNNDAGIRATSRRASIY